ncbi:helicase HerA-like domain-containing protein [Sinimarinibacterium sp. NLF-5-8]|uniref:helicase HerA-like domain-containing protein n=1 Tax=Sinimarinibacterium sp. NLF-5-8 TaxID=2698684 RepID=UPI00137BE7A6|nr:helicase HerA-like domain-containing protein [Sinimarinibacterium sp. NLF-5-8]QHS10401.1 DUF853 family protein [Sinimarinibacterium sp. NLF-5-8]
MNDRVLIGKGDEHSQQIWARYANRHGLVAGATGTGKTISLQILAEGFSEIGVPVFAADIKGDLSGIAVAAEDNPKLRARAEKVGMEGYAPGANPTVFWDVFGELGHPIRATISDMGPILLARLLDLTDVQTSVLNLVFKYADDQGLLLLDMKDLRATLQHVAQNAKQLGADYGLVSTASVGAIQRALLQLEQDGAEAFFGEPALDLNDLMRCDFSGRGIVNILAAEKLYMKPRLYATFLLWLLSELFERLPEQGDADRPRLVFFFDEAHLLFKDAPKALVEKVEQVVRLIRSKGVGVYFVTQNPLDLPDAVLGQLGNRVQHALRAFTPRDQKAVKAAAETFRSNPKLKVAEVIGELGVGEALVSTLEEKGIPSVVERTVVRPPRSRMGAISLDERRAIIGRSPYGGRYDTAIDRESAYEMLAARAQAVAPPPDRGAQGSNGDLGWWDRKDAPAPTAPRKAARAPAAKKQPDTMLETALKSAARSAASQAGRTLSQQLMRGLLGSLTGKR